MSIETFKRLVDTVNIKEACKLPAIETWSDSYHVFEKRDLLAIDAARAAQRPLLVRGMPGTGKSQLARAAAKVLGYRFISKVIDAQTEIEDLWFRYDAVRRLGEAQLLGAGQRNYSEADLKKKLDLKHFVIPGPMWWAFDRQSAAEHCQEASLDEQEFAVYLSEKNSLAEEIASEQSSVLLLDEIDKADADLANSLLEALGNGSFRINMLGKTIGSKNSTTCPLVIITSNEEKHLPPAFLRRCVVLELSLPSTKEEFCDLLCRRGEQHHPDKDTLDKEVLQKAAEQLWEDRQGAKVKGVPLPGQAEYLDMLNVLVKSSTDKDKQLNLLTRVSEFIFRKHGAGKDQNGD